MASGVKKGIAAGAARQIAPKVVQLAPGITQSFVREALHRAIAGVGPLPPAAAAAEEQLREQHGHVGKAVREVVENHVTYAGLEGFVTNLGGLITTTLIAPASVSGLALIQCRMVAGIAHLHGHDLDDPRVRAAILEVLLGEEAVRRLVKQRTLPGPPLAVATAPELDPGLERTISNVLAGELVARMVGKRAVVAVGKKVPIVGGVVGAVADGTSTFKVGRYAGRALRPSGR